jgi:hypothetical protein
MREGCPSPLPSYDATVAQQRKYSFVSAALQISQPLRQDPPAFTPADRAICPPLTLEERARLRTLEQVIDCSINSFLECGRALSEVKSSRLYRESYPSWDAYVRDDSLRQSDPPACERFLVDHTL